MKVLIVKTSSMGDVIHSFPAVEDALRSVPGLTLDWCVEEAFADIVALHPGVGSIHRVAIRRWRKALLRVPTWGEAAALRRSLISGRYDLVIDAQGLLKSALVARLAGAPVAGLDRRSAREGAAAMLYASRHFVPRGQHAIDRTRQLFGQALGYAPDLSALDFGIEPPEPRGFSVAGPAAFLIHGTSRADKKWPAASWIETARLLAASGMTPVTTFASEVEREVAEAIGRAVPETVIVPRSELRDVAAIIGRSALVVGADTGLTHLASAFGLPTIGIFLTTEPGLTAPRGDYACALTAVEGRPVTPAQAITEAWRLLEARRGATRGSQRPVGGEAG
jgi:heptosyltransferase-1